MSAQDILKKLETLQASLREFEEARQRSGGQPVLHPALRQAVWDAVAENSARSFRVEAKDLWKASREFRKSLKAFTHGANAGESGYWRALWARAQWKEFPQDYLVELSVDGTEFRVDYVASESLSTTTLIQTSQFAPSPSATRNRGNS